jgi:hypothetical protein
VGAAARLRPVLASSRDDDGALEVWLTNDTRADVDDVDPQPLGEGATPRGA